MLPVSFAINRQCNFKFLKILMLKQHFPKMPVFETMQLLVVTKQVFSVFLVVIFSGVIVCNRSGYNE